MESFAEFVARTVPRMPEIEDGDIFPRTLRWQISMVNRRRFMAQVGRTYSCYAPRGFDLLDRKARRIQAEVHDWRAAMHGKNPLDEGYPDNVRDI